MSDDRRVSMAQKSKGRGSASKGVYDLIEIHFNILLDIILMSKQLKNKLMSVQFNTDERGSGDMGPRASRGKSIADTAKPALDVKKPTDQRRGSAVFDADKGAKGSFGAVRKKSAGMSKEGKMKQKKADEAALRKNKVMWHLLDHKYILLVCVLIS